MMGEYLLDTVIIVRFYQKHDPAIIQRLASINRLFLSSITLGELYHGAYRSLRRQQNIARVDVLRQNFPILPCDADTATIYGEIKAQLQDIGKPIPANDIWIAALARQHDLTLATHDAHFSHVTGTRVEIW